MAKLRGKRRKRIIIVEPPKGPERPTREIVTTVGIQQGLPTALREEKRIEEGKETTTTVGLDKGRPTLVRQEKRVERQH